MSHYILILILNVPGFHRAVPQPAVFNTMSTCQAVGQSLVAKNPKRLKFVCLPKQE